jgi:hypothetical protein
MKLCWFMRGSLSYTEAHMLTGDERMYIANLISSNLETTKTSGMPFF